jgi:hypothetical protein
MKVKRQQLAEDVRKTVDRGVVVAL